MSATFTFFGEDGIRLRVTIVEFENRNATIGSNTLLAGFDRNRPSWRVFGLI